jgi:hypothetical protein
MDGQHKGEALVMVVWLWRLHYRQILRQGYRRWTWERQRISTRIRHTFTAVATRVGGEEGGRRRGRSGGRDKRQVDNQPVQWEAKRVVQWEDKRATAWEAEKATQQYDDKRGCDNQPGQQDNEKGVQQEDVEKWQRRNIPGVWQATRQGGYSSLKNKQIYTTRLGMRCWRARRLLSGLQREPLMALAATLMCCGWGGMLTEGVLTKYMSNQI